MRLSFLRPVLLAAAFIALVGGAVAIEQWTITRLLRDDAVATAAAWSKFLAASTDDLRQIAEGAAPSADTIAFRARIKGASRIFRYRVYTPNGMLRFVSDGVGAVKSTEVDADAAAATHADTPLVTERQAQRSDRPAFYADVYIPQFDASGKAFAVLEIYIDQTGKHLTFEQVSLISTIALGLLLAAALGVPATGWSQRRREQERARGRLEYLASHDILSGLANNKQFFEELNNALTEAGPRSRLAIHRIDIDHFGDVNNWLGMAVGDQIIKIIAERLRAVAAADDLIARISGDEFAIVQRGGRERIAAVMFAEKVAQAIAIPFDIGGREVSLTASIGVALAPDDGADPERLSKSAKLALAKGKSEARGRVRFFDRELDGEMTARLKVEHAVATALATGGLTLHYQPLYSEPGETLTGFEALARLQLPDDTMIPPSLFIPAAERMGAIDRLGAWVLLEACTTAAAWPEHLTLSVNLSPTQFGNASVADIVGSALARSGLTPNRLLLEITESVLIADRQNVTAELAKLKALGTRIVMDDFGTGYSSLSYLWQFPFDKIKIDGSFMHAFDVADVPPKRSCEPSSRSATRLACVSASKASSMSATRHARVVSVATRCRVSTSAVPCRLPTSRPPFPPTSATLP
ncbi:MAG TPA: EAL domain-containing protein [Bauldia sp.]